MATRDYQLVKDITWKDEHLRTNGDKHSTLKQSYGTLSRALEEMNRKPGPAVESRTSRIIFKPTGETLREMTW